MLVKLKDSYECTGTMERSLLKESVEQEDRKKQMKKYQYFCAVIFYAIEKFEMSSLLKVFVEIRNAL